MLYKYVQSSKGGRLDDSIDTNVGVGIGLTLALWIDTLFLSSVQHVAHWTE